MGEPSRTVGRRDELDAVDDVLTALRSGSVAALVLRGEAGIGKSHLCRAAAAGAAAAGIRTAVGCADELEQDRPGRLLLAVEAALPAGEHDPVGQLEHHQRDGGDPGYRAVERFLTAIERAASTGPLLIVAEDLHWADDLSLRGLASLIRSIEHLPCALLATQRTHPRPRRLAGVEAEISKLSHRVQCRTIDLGGLAPSEVEQLACERLGAAPGGRLRTMLAGAGGNAFMVDALLRAVQREGVLRVAGGVIEMPAGDMPSTVHEVLLHHLRVLAPDRVELLQHASLLGRSFTAGEVAVITGSSVVEVVRQLGDAVGAGMVTAEGDHYEFRHDLVREAVHRSIPPAARWDLHRTAGAALANAGAPALRAAQQFVAGARPGDVEAVEWLRRAATDALALDTGAAAELLLRALSLAPAGWTGRFDLEADLVELLAWAGRIDEALGRGQSLIDRAVEGRERFRAHQALGAVRSSIGDLRGAADHLLAASATSGASPTTVEVLRSAAAGMTVIAGTRTSAEARAVATPCMDSDRADVVCCARNTLAVAAMSEGAYDEVVGHARVAASVLDHRYVQPLGFLIPHAWVISGLQALDRYDEARQAVESARRRAERRGDVALLVHVMAATCGVSWAQADWDDLVAEVDAALVLTEETGVVTHTVLFHALAAQIALERGRVDEVAAHLAAAEAAVASGTLHLFGIDLVAAVQARARESAGDPDAACDLLSDVWHVTATLRGLIQWRLIGPELVRLCVATGRDAQAVATASEIGAVAGRSTAPSAAATARRVEGLVQGDVGLLVGAADELLATPRRIEAARACEEAVAVSLTAGRVTDDVGRLLDVAEEIYLRADAVAAIGRLEALRRHAGLGAREVRRRRSRFGWTALTPRELDVVRLVTLGRPNPDIAAELFISRRTVEAHLSHVFQKVGVSNRTQLAREAIERGVV